LPASADHKSKAGVTHEISDMSQSRLLDSSHMLVGSAHMGMLSGAADRDRHSGLSVLSRRRRAGSSSSGSSIRHERCRRARPQPFAGERSMLWPLPRAFSDLMCVCALYSLHRAIMASTPFQPPPLTLSDEQILASQLDWKDPAVARFDRDKLERRIPGEEGTALSGALETCDSNATVR